jgi:hypothetical protein
MLTLRHNCTFAKAFKARGCYQLTGLSELEEPAQFKIYGPGRMIEMDSQLY